MTRLLLSVDDLDDREIRAILDRAHQLAGGAAPSIVQRPLVGLVFFSESTRTRLGFAAAAARLGGSSLDLRAARDAVGMSAAESFEDTVRTVSGMVDVIVVRTSFDLDRSALANAAAAPLVSGGHGAQEHPTQALLDVLAIESERGPVSEQRITLCGDMTMRASRSLLRLLSRNLPQSLSIVAPPGRRAHGVDLSAELARRTTEVEPEDMGATDVLYLPGLPAGEGDHYLDDDARGTYAATAERMRMLPADAVILCPMPAIDEVDPVTRRDPRLRMFQQSDRGVFLRMSVMEHLLGAI